MIPEHNRHSERLGQVADRLPNLIDPAFLKELDFDRIDKRLLFVQHIDYFVAVGISRPIFLMQQLTAIRRSQGQNGRFSEKVCKPL